MTVRHDSIIMSTSHKLSQVQHCGDVYTPSSSLNMLLPFGVAELGTHCLFSGQSGLPYFIVQVPLIYRHLSCRATVLEGADNRYSYSFSDCYLKWLMFLPHISIKNTTTWSVSYYEHAVFMYNLYVHKNLYYNRFYVLFRS